MSDYLIQGGPPPREAPNPPARTGRIAGWLWTAVAFLVAALVVGPVLSVALIALDPIENIWPHLMATTLPRYFGNTVAVASAVGLLAAVAGTVTAWLVTLYRFPMSHVLEWLLLAPLSIPAYIGAYALVDVLDYAGPVQTALRGAMGWTSARDYWFPEIRALWAAVIVMAAALYPYVYLLVRAALREQPAESYEVARSLGAGPVGTFVRVGLPLARPAIAAGTAIVMMEAVNDFGTVSYFSVQTLTTGIFSVWLSAGNAGGAAQIACVILVIMAVLIAAERIGRRRARFHQSGRQVRPVVRRQLRGLRALAATAVCLVPVLLGFVLPLSVMGYHATADLGGWINPGLGKALVNTLSVGAAASVLAVLLGLVMVYGVRLTGRRLPRYVLPLTTIGYAVPGAVLAVGLLLPLATFDNRLADVVLSLTGHDPGLILTGTVAALVLAYLVRFFAIAQGAADAAFSRVAPTLPMAARALGRTEGGTLRDVYVPLMRGSIATALLLVFVDCVKELPATLLLRPFNFETLATRAHEKASLENLGDAAPAAILVMVVGLAAVAVMARTEIGRRSAPVS